MEDLDNYTNRLSVKEGMAYEYAEDLMKQSMESLKKKKYKSDNLIKSAYKYSRKKISSQQGGSVDLIKQKYLKYKKKYLQLKNLSGGANHCNQCGGFHSKEHNCQH